MPGKWGARAGRAPPRSANDPGAETIAVTLHRNDSNEPWGFRLNGGIDFTTPLSISQVCVNLEFSFIEGYFCMYFLQGARRPKKAWTFRAFLPF